MILRTENLIKKYGQRLVNNQVSYQVAQGEIVGLLGPNGAGKTTSFYMATGLVKPNSGKVYLDDLDVTDLPMYKRARLGIGYLAQEASVFRSLSVEENILAVLEMTKLSKKEQKEKTEQLLEEFSLTQVRKNLGQVLSGEEIQSIVARLKLKNIGVLITDHNVDETLSITDRAYLLYEGKILKYGTPQELADDEEVRRLYLGKHFELKRKV
jgi:lipopolysaccharide export system ATP-binding protein